MDQELDIIIDLSKRFFTIAAVFVAGFLLVCVGFLFYQYNVSPQNSPHEITVSGQGKAFGKPDVALVTLGVTTRAQKSQDAVNQNNDKMNAVIKAIKDLGVDDKDIQTTLYNLTPVYDYPRILQPSSAAPGAILAPTYVGGGRVFGGYSLDQELSVKIRDFEKISAILDKATAAGATNVGDLQFAIDNPEKVQSEARAKAIANAKEKLADIMRQSGLQVGKLVNISEGYGGYPQPLYGAAAGAKDVATTAPQIQTGQQEVDSTVTLTYQVR